MGSARRFAFPACIALVFAAAFVPLASQGPTLDDVLTRARAAVARYQEQAALLIADEQCDQKAFEGGTERSNSAFSYTGNSLRIDPKGRRKWQAELAMVPTPSLADQGYPWQEYRDIVSADGRPIPDRGDRLSRLFQDPSGWTITKATAIAQDSARFNVGDFLHMINTPAEPLLVLHAVNARRFQFDKTGEETIDRIPAWKLEYRERLAPTLISTGDAFCPATGTVWVDPATGDVLRATLQCTPTNAEENITRITVRYRVDSKVGIRVPVEMQENPEGHATRASWGQAGRAWMEGKCTYSNFRRIEKPGRMIGGR